MILLSADVYSLQIALLIVSACFLPVIIWMFAAGIRVKTQFNKYSAVQSEKGFTGAQAARAILDANGMKDVQIIRCAGSLTDHYDPTTRTVALSQATHDSSSVAAIGVAAHEVGHAIQHEEGYAPVKIRTKLVPVVNFTSRLSLPLILIAMIFELMGYFSDFSMQLSTFFLGLAVLCYFFYCLFTFITLPTEYNASSRAKKQLVECGILNETEVKDVSAVLSAAAKTYLVNFTFSLIQMLRLLFIVLIRRNGNNRR